MGDRGGRFAMSEGREPGHRSTTDRKLVEQANSNFYAAFEHGDFDAMQAVWADDDGVVCVHPASPPIRGRFAVMRSWMALIAADSYIQFFLTDVDVAVMGDVASVTCTENVLAAGPDTPPGAFTGGSATATNVFLRTPDGWRLWIHHASPVLSGQPTDEPETD
jgi:ketosteroid isomerase-like protein